MTPPYTIDTVEMPYISALLEAYSDELRIKINGIEMLKKHNCYFEHLKRQRKDYYSIETIRRFVRDVFTNSKQFDILKDEIYDFYVSLLVSMFHTKNTEGEKQKHCGSDSKTLRERESAPSVFWKMKHETKNETLKSYVSFSEMIDIQLLYNKKWNMKDKSKVLKTYRDFVR